MPVPRISGPSCPGELWATRSGHGAGHRVRRSLLCSVPRPQSPPVQRGSRWAPPPGGEGPGREGLALGRGRLAFVSGCLTLTGGSGGPAGVGWAARRAPASVPCFSPAPMLLGTYRAARGPESQAPAQSSLQPLAGCFLVGSKALLWVGGWGAAWRPEAGRTGSQDPAPPMAGTPGQFQPQDPCSLGL